MRTFWLLRALSVSLALAFGASLFVAQTAFAADIYVDAFAGDDLTGTGARTAPYATVGAGLAAAASGDTVIAGMGVYPERISLRSGVALEGAGEGLSVLWGGRTGRVVNASSLASTATVSGFTISGGYATSGAGVHCDSSHLEIRDCEITNNIATSISTGGGGLFIENHSSAVIEDCEITENSAPSSNGGGLIVYNYSSARIEDCTFADNIANRAGGMILTYTFSSDVEVRRCLVSDNVSTNIDENGYTWGGGGAYLVETEARFYDCVFTGNTAASDGGAVFAWDWSPYPVFMNCTFVDNQAARGDGVHSRSSTTATKLLNCILWGNGDDLRGVAARYSCIEDGDAGTGNISSDPMFVSSADYQLQPSSPCIDAGTFDLMSGSDFDGTPRPIDGDRDGVALPDMGAYEAWGADTTEPDEPGLSSATHPESTWVPGTAAVVSIAAPSDFSGIAGYSVEWNEGHAHTPDTSVDLAGGATQTSRTLTDGEWYVSVRAVDGAGNWSAGTTFGPMLVDSTVPSSSDDAPAGWQHAPVTVTITAEDVGAGLASVNATATDPPPGGMRGFTSAGTPLSVDVSEEGTTTIEYAAVDGAWNASAPGFCTVSIDWTAPEVALTPDGAAFNDAAVFSIDATDTVSGVASVCFAVDGGSEQTSSSVTIETVGNHSIEYWAVDVAGNESAHQTHSFTVSTSATQYVTVAGANRFATSAAASKRAFPGGADTVVIATGRDWPDAMGGAALAGAYDAPILLTDTHSLPTTVAAEIDRLGATKAFVLGGEGAVGPEVIDALEGVGLAAEDIARIGGTNRYQTAELVAEAVIDRLGDDYDGTAFVTTGVAFPDALAAAPLAASNGWPAYLAKPGGDSMAFTSALKAAGVTDAIVLGGEVAVSSAYFDTLNVGLDSAMRLAGSDRYATAVEVARYGVDTTGLAWDGLGITTGLDFPDALSGGVLCARNGSVMLLTKPLTLPGSVADELAAERDVIGTVYYIGGAGSVSDQVRNEITQILH